jgi:twinkle protein
MAFVKQNLPCPLEDCNSSDAFAIDDKGWGKCFSCYKSVPPDAVADDGFVHKAKPAPTVTTSASADLGTSKVVTKAILDRKISVNTAGRYSVGYQGKDLVFPYGDKAAKVRINGEKKFTIKGDWKGYKGLFGQDKFSANGKLVVVTEGEIDAMSAFQMLDSRYPVVSVRNGASAAVKDCKDNYEFLDGFDSIFVCFDNDDPGKEAAKQVAELFSRKAKIVVLPADVKDANDMLCDSRETEFSVALWRAAPYVPDGIIAGESLYDVVMEPVQGSDVDYGYAGLDALTYGIRKGEMTTVCAGSGLGKSQFLREVAWNIIQNTEDNIGLMFMEEGVRKTGLSLMSLAADKPMHLPHCTVEPALKDKAYADTLGTGRVFLFDHFGSSDIDNIVSRVRYMAKALDCSYIFLDHLSIIVSDQRNGDERLALDEIVTKLSTVVRETGIALFCVSHLKRPSDKGHEEGAITSLAHLRGTAAIAQLSDMVISLERNGQADDPTVRNTTTVRILKNRFSGTTGKACALLYSHDTGRMVETVLADEDEAL